MPSSKTEICNLALQRLGIESISDITEDSVAGRACLRCYDSVVNQELEDHNWAFSVKRRRLAESTETPVHGRANLFDLPEDCLHLIGPYPEYNLASTDWLVEGRQIATDDSAPLDVRYVAIVDESVFSPLFAKVVYLEMAAQMCQELTQSSTMKAEIMNEKELTIRRAKKRNAIQQISVSPPEPSWITVRA